MCDVPSMPPPAKKAKNSSTQSTSFQDTFASKIRQSPMWLTEDNLGEWKNLTTDKSRRTLMIRTNSAGDQFCMVGKVFSSRLSAEDLSKPTPFEGGEEHTDLEIHLTMRESAAEPSAWQGYNEDIAQQLACLEGQRSSAIKDAFTPHILDKDTEKLVGLPVDKLKRFKKHINHPEKVHESLDDQWGGTGISTSGDIVRMKRRCYNENDLSDAKVFMEKWLQVNDENGEPLNYIEDNSAINNGDTVLVWFRILSQCCAGNFHVSLEPRAIMRLEKGNSGGSSGKEGSAAFAAAMAKAMQRDE